MIHYSSIVWSEERCYHDGSLIRCLVRKEQGRMSPKVYMKKRKTPRDNVVHGGEPYPGGRGRALTHQTLRKWVGELTFRYPRVSPLACSHVSVSCTVLLMCLWQSQACLICAYKQADFSWAPWGFVLASLASFLPPPPGTPSTCCWDLWSSWCPMVFQVCAELCLPPLV